MNRYHFAGVLLAFAMTAAGAREGTLPELNPLPANPNGKQEQPAPPPSRGELLYENHCTGCHASVVHVRENRRAKSAPEVDAWVRRWAGELKLNWSDEEIGDVTRHLVRRYYKFDARSTHK